MGKKQFISFTGKELGSILFEPEEFSQELYKEIEGSHFRTLTLFAKHDKLSRTLFEALSRHSEPAFLLPQLVSFIARVRKAVPTYHLASFEFWMNQTSDFSEEEKMDVRAKIVGKKVPRGEYQSWFPIGSGAKFAGSHYAYAHISPDVDTTVASFFCFLSAFGAKVGTQQHHWVIPGGPPKGSIEMDHLFREIFGRDVFTFLSQADSKFYSTSLDHISHSNIIYKELHQSTYDMDHNGINEAVIIVDKEGAYLGDWRSTDVDLVRSILSRFLAMLIEVQNRLFAEMISLFAKKDVHGDATRELVAHCLSTQFSASHASRGLSEKARGLLNLFMRDVLGLKRGYGASVGEFLQVFGVYGYEKFEKKLEELKGARREDLFEKLEGAVLANNAAFMQFSNKMESFEIALLIKHRVLKLTPHYLSHLAQYDEIREKIGAYDHLTVNYTEGEKLYPLGVIYRETIFKKSVASASWNDFSNPDEVDFREEVQLISYLDHHKSEVKTTKPVLGIVKDAQSSNSITANLHFQTNDKYSTGGMTLPRQGVLHC